MNARAGEGNDSGCAFAWGARAAVHATSAVNVKAMVITREDRFTLNRATSSGVDIAHSTAGAGSACLEWAQIRGVEIPCPLEMDRAKKDDTARVPKQEARGDRAPLRANANSVENRVDEDPRAAALVAGLHSTFSFVGEQEALDRLELARLEGQEHPIPLGLPRGVQGAERHAVAEEIVALDPGAPEQPSLNGRIGHIPDGHASQRLSVPIGRLVRAAPHDAVREGVPFAGHLVRPS